MVAVLEKPWYRQFWVWFMLTPLIATVLASVVTLFLAGSTPDLVVDDFGQIAMAIDQDQSRDHRAAELGLTAQLQFDPRPASGGQAVAVSLSGASPQRLRLDLIHPTRSDMDQSVLLSRTGDVYSGVVPRPASRMYVQITDEAGAWRLTGQLGAGRTSVDLAAGH